MKPDIEGAEALAVEGFGDELSECRELFSEIHTHPNAAQSIHSHGTAEDEYFGRMEGY